jgi:ATP-dependent RNA helicase DDX5/DBP2
MEDYVHRIGRIGRARTLSHATSFYMDNLFFLVAQIMWAIIDAKLGNTMVFAIGKVERKKEREQATTFRERRLVLVRMTHIGATTIWVDDKYKHMIAPFVNTKKGEGATNDAWED